MIEMSASDLSDEKGVDWNVINGSSIGISMDVTNQHIAFTLQLKFVEAFQQVPSNSVDSTRVTYIRPVQWQLRLTHVSSMSASPATAVAQSMEFSSGTSIDGKKVKSLSNIRCIFLHRAYSLIRVLSFAKNSTIGQKTQPLGVALVRLQQVAQNIRSATPYCALRVLRFMSNN